MSTAIKDDKDLVHWLIRDCDDGSERSTHCVRQTTWTYRGLRRMLLEKIEEQRDFLRCAWSVNQGVIKEEPILLLCLVLGIALSNIDPIVQLFCKMKILVLTQGAFEGKEVDAGQAMLYLSLWLGSTWITKAINSRLAFFIGRFKVLYILAVEQSILNATANIILELKEQEGTKDLLEESKKLAKAEPVQGDTLLPEVIISIGVRWLFLPIRLAAMIALVPRSCAPLILWMALYWLLEKPISNAFAAYDWSNSTTKSHKPFKPHSSPNEATVRHWNESKAGQRRTVVRTAAGIGPYIRDTFRYAALSLEATVSSKRERLDQIDKRARDELLSSLRTGVQLALVILFTRNGPLATSTSVAFAVIEHTASRFADELKTISTTYERLGRRMQQASALSRYIELSKECIAMESKSKPVPTLDLPQPGLSLEVRNVSFSYPNHHQPVLRNLSFDIPAGSLVAVTGFNGAGKSSLISVLSRAYDVQEGEVLINGTNIKELNPDNLARSVAVLPQSAKVFDLPLKENIAFADSENENVVRRAAQAAGARGFIEKLDHQYDACTASSQQWLVRHCKSRGLQPVTSSDRLTIVDETGKPLVANDRTLVPVDLDTNKETARQAITKLIMHDHAPGIKLSGGELQKVVLSRAFAKESQLCIFDEPGSNLDPESEFHLFQEIAAIKGKKTIIYISHRWKGITDNADLVLFMEDGQVKEQGNHARLMAEDGTYARLWRLQTESDGLATA